jgi:nucleoside-diphosphate-sugar epimerase
LWGRDLYVRFLLFGGVGFVGVNLARHLAARGHDVVLAKRRGIPPRPLIARALSGLKVMEYSDPAELIESTNPDVVVNLVAALHGTREEIRRANAEFPSLLCDAARRAGWRNRVVHISAATVVGLGASREEDAHLDGVRPATYFDQTKAEGEQAIARCFEDWVIVRPTAIYGPYNDHPEWAALVRAARAGIAPSLKLSFSAISSSDLSAVVERSASLAPPRQYFFATECKPLEFELVVDALEEAAGRRLARIPLPLALARLLAPSGVRGLLKYAGTPYSCEKMRRAVGYEATYRKSDMVEMFRLLWS